MPVPNVPVSLDAPPPAHHRPQPQQQQQPRSGSPAFRPPGTAEAPGPLVQRRHLSASRSGLARTLDAVAISSQPPATGARGAAGAAQGAVVDVFSSNITVTSVELAERERVTQILRQQVAQLGKERSQLQRGLAEMKRYTQRLEAKLTAGGMTAAYARLDAKYQAVRRQNTAAVEALRVAEDRCGLQDVELRRVHAALELHAEDLGASADHLLEIARGGEKYDELTRAVAERETLAAELSRSLDQQQGEAVELKKRVVELDEEVRHKEEQHAILEQALSQLRKEHEAVSAERVRLGNDCARLRESEAAARQEAEEATRRADDLAAAQTDAAAEAEQRAADAQLLGEVAERQLEEERRRVQELEDRLRGVHEAPELERALGEAQQRAEEFRRRMSAEEGARRGAERRAEADAAQCRDLRTQLEELQGRLRRTQDEAGDLRREQGKHAKQHQEHATLQQRFNEIAQENAALRRRADEGAAQLAAQEQQLQVVQQQLQQRDAEVQRLQLLCDAQSAQRRNRGASTPAARAPTETQYEDSSATRHVPYSHRERQWREALYRVERAAGDGRATRALAGRLLEQDDEVRRLVSECDLELLRRELLQAAPDSGGGAEHRPLQWEDWHRLLLHSRRGSGHAAASPAGQPLMQGDAENSGHGGVGVAQPEGPARGGGAFPRAAEPGQEHHPQQHQQQQQGGAVPAAPATGGVSPAVAAAFAMATTPPPPSRPLPGAAGPVSGAGGASPLQHSLSLSASEASPLHGTPAPPPRALQAAAGDGSGGRPPPPPAGGSSAPVPEAGLHAGYGGRREEAAAALPCLSDTPDIPEEEIQYLVSRAAGASPPPPRQEQQQHSRGPSPEGGSVGQRRGSARRRSSHGDGSDEESRAVVAAHAGGADAPAAAAQAPPRAPSLQDLAYSGYP